MKIPRISALVTILLLASCTATTPIKTVSQVDLDRFMGKWYVIANIPTFFERDVLNPTETYELTPEGYIDTKFEFYDPNSERSKSYNPKAYILNKETNATWGMQFIWPFKADFRIVYLNQDYSATVIGRSKRDYIWLMARTPEISDSIYEDMLKKAETLGYDVTKIERAIHQPINE